MAGRSLSVSKQREIRRLRFEEKLSFSKIADQLGITVVTVRKYAPDDGPKKPTATNVYRLPKTTKPDRQAQREWCENLQAAGYPTHRIVEVTGLPLEVVLRWVG